MSCLWSRCLAREALSIARKCVPTPHSATLAQQFRVAPHTTHRIQPWRHTPMPHTHQSTSSPYDPRGPSRRVRRPPPPPAATTPVPPAPAPPAAAPPPAGRPHQAFALSLLFLLLSLSSSSARRRQLSSNPPATTPRPSRASASHSIFTTSGATATAGARCSGGI